MVYAGVLVVARRADGRRAYLLGQENGEAGWADRDTWSDFGGAAHDAGDLRGSAADELHEETMGFLGSRAALYARLAGAPYLDLPGGAGRVYVLRVRFDAALPRVYADVWDYFNRCAASADGKRVIRACPEGYFEKRRLRWFSAHEILAAPGVRPVFRRSFRALLAAGAPV